jgi:hypothetical protein
MLTFPAPRMGTCTTGGGATTTAENSAIPCRAETASTLGGGATTEAAGRLGRREVVWAMTGGGDTTELTAAAAGSCKLLALEFPSSVSGGVGVKFGRDDLVTLRAAGGRARRVRCAAEIVRRWPKSFRPGDWLRIREGLLPSAGKDGGGV